MTTAQIQDLIFKISGHQVGCRKNTGSMKPYLTFQIKAKRDQYTKKFTDAQRKEIETSLNMRGIFTDWYRIEIPAKYITQQQPAQAIQQPLF